MSDHPEVPRVEFDGDGESMCVEVAVERFRRLLQQRAQKHLVERESGWTAFSLKIEIRVCDCDSALNGRDEYCPLHGDKA